MAQEGEVILLTSLLSTYCACITYQPLRTEVAFATYIQLAETLRVHEIPPRASEDPLAEAAKAVVFAGDARTVMLIPGRSFDTLGTRHGQGGGWYDRFLAHVPREWLRIGFCYEEQFSHSPLRRETWDQSMDIVVVTNRKTGALTLYSSEGVPT